jgi:hypothetical protein
MESYVRSIMVRSITTFAAFAAVVMTGVLLIALAGVVTGCGAGLKSPEHYADPCGQNADCMDFCASEASSALSNCTEPYGCYNVRAKLEASDCATAWRAREGTGNQATTHQGNQHAARVEGRRTGKVKALVKQDGRALTVRFAPECLTFDSAAVAEPRPCVRRGIARGYKVIMEVPGTNGQPVSLPIGLTNDVGLFKVDDLDTVIPSAAVVLPPTATIGCWFPEGTEMSLEFLGPTIGAPCTVSNSSELHPIDLTTVTSVRDDRLWAQSNVGGCRSPTALDSCAGVQRYLATFKGVGNHSEDAAAILKQATPALMGLADEKRWSSIDLEACRSYSGADPEGVNQTCAPVSDYLKAFPNGAHADMARSALDQGKKIHDQLVVRTAAAERQEQAAEAVRQRAGEAKRRQQCMGACRIQCSGKLHFDECFAGCPALCQ